MITERDLRELASQYTGETPHPNSCFCRCALMLEAMQNKHSIGLALYYGYMFELGETLECAMAEAEYYTCEQDIIDSLKEELDEYCIPSWQTKLKQLAELK